jgi:hypothetical protein
MIFRDVGIVPNVAEACVGLKLYDRSSLLRLGDAMAVGAFS